MYLVDSKKSGELRFSDSDLLLRYFRLVFSCRCRAIWFPRLRKTDGIRGIASRKRNIMKSNGICGIGDFLGFFNASTHRPKIYCSLFHPYLTYLRSPTYTCGVNVWSANAQSQCSVNPEITVSTFVYSKKEKRTETEKKGNLLVKIEKRNLP